MKKTITYIKNTNKTKNTSGFISDLSFINVSNIDNISISNCRFNVVNFKNSLFDKLDIKMPEDIRYSSTKRQSEYLAGRYMAQISMSSMGFEKANIARGLNNSPVWPNGVIGSISHSNDEAYSIVASSNDYKFLGIDYEKIINDEISKEVYNSIANEKELRNVMNLGFEFSHALTIIFSSKESLFKALHPHTKFYFDFLDATLINLTPKDNQFEIKLNKTLNESLTENMVFKGIYKISYENILTVVIG